MEAALGRTIPVVPVLVQGARMPAAQDLPPSLAALATRQAVTLDYDEFHDDADRLCDRLAPMIGFGAPVHRSIVRNGGPPQQSPQSWHSDLLIGPPTEPRRGRHTKQSLRTHRRTAQRHRSSRHRGGPAAAQPGRGRARDAGQGPSAGPASAPRAREAQEDVAMEWIRNVRVENDKSSFGDAIKPALAIVDAALPTETGPRRADLLAHTGWATFLLWRDGDRRLNPGGRVPGSAVDRSEEPIRERDAGTLDAVPGPTGGGRPR